jgi:hypothetical protein
MLALAPFVLSDNSIDSLADHPRQKHGLSSQQYGPSEQRGALAPRDRIHRRIDGKPKSP